MESVQARRFTTLVNLVALTSLTWALLAAYSERRDRLAEHTRPQKRKRPSLLCTRCWPAASACLPAYATSSTDGRDILRRPHQRLIISSMMIHAPSCQRLHEFRGETRRDYCLPKRDLP